MARSRPSFLEARADGLRVVHRPGIDPLLIARALALHRVNAARGREHCEHWGPGSSVSRIVLRTRRGELDLAVKWNHWRGLRGVGSDLLFGSRAVRAVAGAELLRSVGIAHPETLAVAERRRFGVVVESYLVTRFLADAAPLPVAMADLRGAYRRRRALATAIGDAVGSLHAAGLDHADLKHSNLLVTAAGEVALLDLDSLVPPRAPGWRGRVRALGQLEAYATDLYPWLPRSDRARFLRAYLRHAPELRPRRRALVADVRRWVARRLARWEGRDRALHIYYPLAPRATRPHTVVDLVGAPSGRPLPQGGAARER